jgi:hypothetical protein
MTRKKWLTVAALIFGAALLWFARSGSSNPSPLAQATEPPPAKRAAEALAKEWTFGPEKDQKPQSYGSSSFKSGENLMVASARLQDKGKAREWMARASAFYSRKCGSDKDPLKLHAETGKHQLGISGEVKNKGRYLIDEPGLMLIPLDQLPPRPKELVFAYHDADSTATAVVWQQGDDVVLISVTAAVR